MTEEIQDVLLKKEDTPEELEAYLESLLEDFAGKYSLLSPATALLNEEMQDAVKKGIEMTVQELPSWNAFYEAQRTFEEVVNQLGRFLQVKKK